MHRYFSVEILCDDFFNGLTYKIHKIGILQRDAKKFSSFYFAMHSFGQGGDFPQLFLHQLEEKTNISNFGTQQLAS